MKKTQLVIASASIIKDAANQLRLENYFYYHQGGSCYD